MDEFDLKEECEQLRFMLEQQRKINNKLLYLYQKKIKENEKYRKKDNGWRPHSSPCTELFS